VSGPEIVFSFWTDRKTGGQRGPRYFTGHDKDGISPAVTPARAGDLRPAGRDLWPADDFFYSEP
jgi:hypothetical protein